MILQHQEVVQIPDDHAAIEGLLELPANAHGLVLFVHGSGSSRHSPRHTRVAQALHEAGIGTLLLDLLSVSEDLDYQTRFDICLLTHRLLLATCWTRLQNETRHLRKRGSNQL